MEKEKLTLGQLDWMLKKTEGLWQNCLISNQTMDDIRTAIDYEKKALLTPLTPSVINEEQ